MNGDCQQLFNLIYVILFIFALLFIMLLNYNLKLDKRTLTLEKKNGHEQHQIDQLKEELKQLKTKQKNHETSNKN